MEWDKMGVRGEMGERKGRGDEERGRKRGRGNAPDEKREKEESGKEGNTRSRRRG